jgi:hypothetical protein
MCENTLKQKFMGKVVRKGFVRGEKAQRTKSIRETHKRGMWQQQRQK